MASQLLPLSERAKQLVAKKTTKVADVVRLAENAKQAILRANVSDSLAERLPAPEGEMVLNAEDRDKLAVLIDTLDALPATPDSVRELSAAEIHAYVGAFAAVKDVAGVIKDRETLLGTLFKNDNTARGEREGNVTDETPRDGKGWAITGRKYTAPGVTAVASLESRQGAVTLDPAALKALADSEKARCSVAEADGSYPEPIFTHEDYLACTTQVRVLDERKVLARIASNPEITEALGSAATVQNASISLNKR